VGVNGHGVVRFKKPDVGKTYPITTFPTSDEFNSKTLGMEWGWNHNPDTANWSLIKRPGYLRLTTGKAVANLTQARNTLTQRPFAKRDQTNPTVAVTRIEAAHIKDGDDAGLAVFEDPYAYVAVRQTKGIKYIVMVNNGKTVDSVSTNKSTIYLRTLASNATKKATFGYSFDNKSFKPIGNEFSMRFNLKVFTGNKFCFFNYATKETGGYVDFDWFRVQ
ncbi:MAG TPA: hypothetical protein VIJ27_03765, partial [Mucilaginibacter sp.]